MKLFLHRILTLGLALAMLYVTISCGMGAYFGYTGQNSFEGIWFGLLLAGAAVNCVIWYVGRWVISPLKGTK